MKKSSKLFFAISIILLIAVASVFGLNYVNEAKLEKEAAIAKEKQELLEKQKAEMILNEEREKALEEAEELFEGYYYDEAINRLKENPKAVNNEIEAKVTEYTNAKNSLVKYEGTVEHIFFHSLILYPEHLFPDLTKPDAGYNAGFAYRSEITKILPQLLERGYVLYDITELFKKNDQGIMEMQDIYLPEGKKPLILSIDDPTYHYGVGFGKSLVITEEGKLMGQVVTPEGDAILSDDSDVELVVDSFVEKHPEFSYRGAKGTVAATGYMGIFGYDLETEESKTSAKAVVEELKKRGWTFASHSYTHNRKGFFGEGSSAGNISYDTREWKRVMEPIVGPTNIFIAPFGYPLSGAALEVILNNGFDIYCTVGVKAKTVVNDRYALMSRNEIGGYALRMYVNEMNNRFFNVDEVIDPYRPPLG